MSTKKSAKKRPAAKKKTGPKPQFGQPMAISMRLDRSDYVAFATAAQAEGKGITTWIRDAAREKAGIR